MEINKSAYAHLKEPLTIASIIALQVVRTAFTQPISDMSFVLCSCLCLCLVMCLCLPCVNNANESLLVLIPPLIIFVHL